LARYSKDGRQYLLLTFAVEASNWWSKPSFPVFAYNALRYLGASGALADQGPTRPGDTLVVPVKPGAKSAEISRPGGAPQKVTPDDGGMVHFGGTQRVGLYKVTPGVEGRDTFAVNLEDDWESNITPKSVTIGSQAVAEGKAIKTANPEVWRWFIGVAFVVLLLEWWIYNRRVMI
jgi:hypothetical protein